jgi:hypothetical protein
MAEMAETISCANTIFVVYSIRRTAYGTIKISAISALSAGPKIYSQRGLNLWDTQSQAINHSIDTIFKDIAGIEVHQETNVQPQ